MSQLRIISQDKTIDIPYQENIFHISESINMKGIQKATLIYKTLSSNHSSILGKYQTKEEAIQMLAQIREAYINEEKVVEL